MLKALPMASHVAPASRAAATVAHLNSSHSSMARELPQRVGRLGWQAIENDETHAVSRA